MEMLARAPDDSGVSSRAVAIQDDYLMKLLATRPIAAVPALPQMSKQLAAPAAALARSAIQAPAGQSPAPVILQSQVSSSVEGPIAAARTVLGGERFAGLRARLLQHQDEFLQQIFDLHRCVRRQRQLVAVCDQPDALVDAVQSLLALPSDPAVDGGSAPAAAASPVWVKPQDAQVVRPVAAQHALVAQPPPGPYAVHGRMAVPYSGPGPLYKGALLQPAGPAPFDPLTAWYCRHYAAPPAYAATAPVLSHAGPAGSFPLATYDGAPGYGYAPTHAVAPWNAGMPPCSASAGGPHVAAAAYDARVAAAPSHGDRWWQDPAQVPAQPWSLPVHAGLHCTSSRVCLLSWTKKLTALPLKSCINAVRRCLAQLGCRVWWLGPPLCRRRAAASAGRVRCAAAMRRSPNSKPSARPESTLACLRVLISLVSAQLLPAGLV